MKNPIKKRSHEIEKKISRKNNYQEKVSSETKLSMSNYLSGKRKQGKIPNTEHHNGKISYEKIKFSINFIRKNPNRYNFYPKISHYKKNHIRKFFREEFSLIAQYIPHISPQKSHKN